MNGTRTPRVVLRVLLAVVGLVVMQIAVVAAPAGAAEAPGAFNKTGPTDGAIDQPLSVTLSWSTSSGTPAPAYFYCYDTSNDNTCFTWGITSSTSAVISGLSPHTTYYWHVLAMNEVGTTFSNGSATAFWRFTTGSHFAPGAFGKTAPANGAFLQPLSVTLSWGASSGAPAPMYEYCYNTILGACSHWRSTSSTSAVVDDLNPNTTYYWHVRAVNSYGTTYSDGSATAYWLFSTGSATVPGAFSKTGPANGAVDQPLALALTWGSAGGLGDGHYEYCYDTSNDSSCSHWTGTTATFTALGGLSPDTTYYWHVRAHNTAGTTYSDGSATAFWHFTTASGPAPVTVRFRSVGAYDGWVRELAEAAGIGGSLNSTSPSCRVGDDGLDRQYRSILHFNTGSLPNDAVITDAVLQFRSRNIVGQNPFQTHGSLTADIRRGGFGGSVALQLADFQASASQTAVGNFGPVPVGGWYSATLGAAAYLDINLQGRTQFRLRFTTDDNDDAGADYLAFYCGDNLLPGNRPVLVITYQVP